MEALADFGRLIEVEKKTYLINEFKYISIIPSINPLFMQ